MSNNNNVLLGLVVTLYMASFISTVAAADPPPEEDRPNPLEFIERIQPTASQSPREIAEKVMPSVVLLVMQDKNGQPIALASGFVVSDGIVATNFHAIDGAGSAVVRLVDQKPSEDDQTRKPWEKIQHQMVVKGVVAFDPEHDLALLAVDGLKTKQLAVGDSEQVAIGDAVYVVGNPQGLEGTFSAGIVSGIRKVGEDSLLQITAPISPGSSGGPVLNAQGEVIGVAVATFKSGQNLNFAIPSIYLSALISKIGPPKSLSELANVSLQGPSIIENMGDHAMEGVTGGDFLWKRGYSDSYSFSLRNHLHQSIWNVRYIVIFYNRNGQVIDALEDKYGPVIGLKKYMHAWIIRPGLAFRISKTASQSIRELTTPSGSNTPDAKIEIRIIDFEIVAPQTVVDEQ